MGNTKAWCSKSLRPLLCIFRVNRKPQHYQKPHKMRIFSIYLSLRMSCDCLLLLFVAMQREKDQPWCYQSAPKQKEAGERGRCKLWFKWCTGHSPNPVLAVAAGSSLPAMDRDCNFSSLLLPFFSVILRSSSLVSVLVQLLLRNACQMLWWEEMCFSLQARRHWILWLRFPLCFWSSACALQCREISLCNIDVPVSRASKVGAVSSPPHRVSKKETGESKSHEMFIFVKKIGNLTSKAFEDAS